MNDPGSYQPYGPGSELCLSVMTLRNATLADRINAAAASGFQSIGWRLEDFTDEKYTKGMNESDIVHMLELSKIRPEEIEFFRSWIGREDDAAYRHRESQLFELAARLGAECMNIAVFEPTEQSEVIHAMRSLCRRAARYGLTVQLEAMAYTPPVNLLQHAWEIVRAVDEPNAGLLIDTWQWAREGESSGSLHLIPPDRITGVQLSDTLPTPPDDVVEESRHLRRIPGSGDLDLPALLRLLTEHGVHAPLSIEVMSDELDALPPIEAAQRIAEGTRAVLQRL